MEEWREGQSRKTAAESSGVWAREMGVSWEKEKLKVSVRLINLMADANSPLREKFFLCRVSFKNNYHVLFY